MSTAVAIDAFLVLVYNFLCQTVTGLSRFVRIEAGGDWSGPFLASLLVWRGYHVQCKSGSWLLSWSLGSPCWTVLSMMTFI